MMIKVYGWDATSPGKRKRRYKIQIVGIKLRSVSKVEKSMDEGWRQSGSGWDPKSKTRLLLYTREFGTKKEWLAWAKLFPYATYEIKEYKKGTTTKAVNEAAKLLEKNK